MRSTKEAALTRFRYLAEDLALSGDLATAGAALRRSVLEVAIPQLCVAAHVQGLRKVNLLRVVQIMVPSAWNDTIVLRPGFVTTASIWCREDRFEESSWAVSGVYKHHERKAHRKTGETVRAGFSLAEDRLVKLDLEDLCRIYKAIHRTVANMAAKADASTRKRWEDHHDQIVFRRSRVMADAS